MISKDETRRIEIKVGDDWVAAEFTQIEPNDVFRMFDPDGTPVVGSNKACETFGKTEFKAADYPYVVLGVMHAVELEGDEIVITPKNTLVSMEAHGRGELTEFAAYPDLTTDSAKELDVSKL